MNTNQQLKKLLKEFQDDYTKSTYASRMEYMSNLKAGATLPAEGRIYGDTWREAFSERAKGRAAEAEKLIAAAVAEARAAAARGPSTEAVNAVHLLALNPSANARDFALIMEKYGDNSQVNRTLVGLATDRKIHLPSSNPTMEKLEAMENLAFNVHNIFSLGSIEQHSGALWNFMVEDAIDAAFEP